MRSVILAAILLAGCARVGSYYDETRLSQLQPGVTTPQQAEAILGGRPTTVAQRADGTTVRVWSYTVASPFGAAAKTATVVFGEDGRMLRAGWTDTRL